MSEIVNREVLRMRRAADNWRRPELRQVEGPNDLKIYGGTIADDIDRWADMIERANGGVENDDMALVPRVPTEEMTEAGEQARRDNTAFYMDGSEVAGDLPQPIWEAMLTAALAKVQPS